MLLQISPFVITSAEQEFIRKFESLHPLLQSGDIPLPTIHPLEHARQMQSYVTLMSLFNSTSIISKEPLITRYNPQLNYKLCTRDEFWNEKIDNTQFGREYDFSKPFFEQWNALMHEVYMQPLVQINCENSPYVDSASNLKDCYMCFGAGESQSCIYCIKSRYPLRNRDCVDCVGILDCELCYRSIDLENCYHCFYTQDSINSRDCFASYDLIGCQDCIGCFGLRRAKFCIFNKQLSEDEYNDYIKSLDLGDYYVHQDLVKKCEAFIAGSSYKASNIKFSENSSGEYLSHCYNACNCYLGESLEDCGWSTGSKGKNCWRSEVLEGELAYNSVVLFGRLGFCNSINTGSENFYSYMIFNSDSCFGCAMLKKKSYCILNKQYSKAEYCQLVPRIIAHMKSTGEWGKFLPPIYAPHYYQESQAYDWFEPITDEEASRRAYRVSNSIAKSLGEATLSAQELSINVKDIDIPSLLSQQIKCKLTAKVYRFDRRELEFYKSQNIPLPRVHWQERLRQLMRKRNLIPSA